MPTKEERERFYQQTGLSPVPHPEVKTVSEQTQKRVEEFLGDDAKALTEEENARLEREGGEIRQNIIDRANFFDVETERIARRDRKEFFSTYGDFRKGENPGFYQALAERLAPLKQRYAYGENLDLEATVQDAVGPMAQEAARESFTEPKVDPVDQYIAERQRTLQDQRGYGSSPDCGRSAGDNLGASARAEVKK